MARITRRRLIRQGWLATGGVSLGLNLQRHVAFAAPWVQRGETAYQFVYFDHPKAVSTWLFGINDAGQIVGYYTDADGGVHAFLRTVDDEQVTDFDHPDAGNVTAAFTINNAGEIVGLYYDAETRGVAPGEGPVPERGVRGYLRSADGEKFINLEHPDGDGNVIGFGSNDAGQLAGTYFTTDETGAVRMHGAVWSAEGQPETTFNHPEGVGGTLANDINDARQLCGQYIDAEQVARAYVWSIGTDSFSDITDLANEGGTCGNALNERGEVTGFSRSGQMGYVWSPEEDTISEFAPVEDAALISGCGINNAGVIVGVFGDALDRLHGFIAVPEA
jgi:probable HAF family extracellular repeat protein